MKLPQSRKIDSKELKTSIWRRSVLISAVLLAVLALILGGLYGITRHSILQRLSRDQYLQLQNMSFRLNSYLENVKSDLYYLSVYDGIIASLENPDSGEEEHIISLMQAIMEFQTGYDHIRILNTSGDEIFRLNRENNGLVIVVEKSELQNKSQRYYFKEIMSLEGDAIYVSSIDLNMENGEIEIPWKSMIRFGKKIYGSDGRLLGAVVINYSVSELFGELEKNLANDDDSFYFLNSRGHYLYHHDPGKTFSFMFPEEHQYLFSEESPAGWSAMSSQQQNHFATNEGVFFSHRVLSTDINGFSEELCPECWYLVIHTPPSHVQETFSVLNLGLTAGGFSVGPLLILLGFLLGRSQAVNMWYFRELERLAERDSHTGLFNKHTIMERLEYTLELSHRRRQPVSVSFVDVNDLKKLNDRKGHHEGDAMIVAIADSLTDVIRRSDSAARIGGDEFLVIFPDCSLRKAEAIMKKIGFVFSRKGRNHDGTAWSISWGCAEYLSGKESAEELVRRADTLMYRHKREIKSESAGVPPN